MQVPPPSRRGDSDNTLVNLLPREKQLHYSGKPLPAPPANVPARAALRRLQRRLIAPALRAGRRFDFGPVAAVPPLADVAGQGIGAGEASLVFQQDVAQGLDADLRVARFDRLLERGKE
jgi:hypothetical protein